MQKTILYTIKTFSKFIRSWTDRQGKILCEIRQMAMHHMRSKISYRIEEKHQQNSSSLRRATFDIRFFYACEKHKHA